MLHNEEDTVFFILNSKCRYKLVNMLSAIPLRAQNASKFSNKTHQQENGDKGNNTESSIEDLPVSLRLENSKRDNKLKVSLFVCLIVFVSIMHWFYLVCL